MVNTNYNILNNLRTQGVNNKLMTQSMKRLASGLRINSAADDAAGLAISEKMRAQIRGYNQASRNIQDGISLIQTAEGGLSQIHNLLRRGRELAVQAANGIFSRQDREKIQMEVDEISKQIDEIAQGTKFNDTKLLDAGRYTQEELQGIVDGLKKSWLEQSEKLIQQWYGLTADGVDLKIILDQVSDPSTLAYVRFWIDGAGKGFNQELHLDVEDFLPATLPNGGTAPFYNDRIVAHEMVHAVMGRTMNYASLPNWFREGTAEFIHGADERLYVDMMNNGGNNLIGVTNVINAIGDGLTWGGSSINYSAGYAAVRFLHDQATGGIKAIMTELTAGKSLDQAIQNTTSYADTATFINDFKSSIGGIAFVDNLRTSGTLSYSDPNADTGAIGGFDADGGPVRNSSTVIPDVENYTDNPLSGFNEIWPEIDVFVKELKLQTGANKNDKVNINLVSATSASIGVAGVDLVNKASEAISIFDNGINYISSERARLGALQNRLEHSLSVNNITEQNTVASESRIRDADMAREMNQMLKSQMLSDAAIAMLAQIGQHSQIVLKLINVA